MAAYVQDVLTFNTTADNKQAVITPAANGLLVACVVISGTTALPTLTDDQSGSYTLIESGLRNSSVAAHWLFVRDALCKPVAHTLTMVPTGDSGGGLDVIEVSGMSRVGRYAVRSNGHTNNIAAGGVPAVTMNQAAASNMVIAMLAANDNTCTATNPTSYTQRQNGGYATPTTGLMVSTRDSGETTATVTWGGTETSASGTIAVELETAGMFSKLPQFEPVPFIPKGRSF